MLQHTFIHLPGVGPITEHELWESGITTWQEFMDVSTLPVRIDGRRSDLHSRLIESKNRLRDSDAAFFESCIPGGERWRLYGDFRDRAAFLDIETTGLSPEHGHITMVGILDAQGYKAYVYGENLADLRNDIEQYDLVVTFNGAAFDLPYVEYHFGRIFKNVAHLDLRFPLKRIGYRGGLKSIEKQLKVGRPSELSVLDGYDAVLMWRMWDDGDQKARDTLIRYNAEDVLSLPALADIVYNRMTRRVPFMSNGLKPWHIPEVDLPYDIDVIERVRRIRTFASSRAL